jgi:hypothetical protein
MMLKMLGEKLFATRTVEEIISGYQDPLLKWGKMFQVSFFKLEFFVLVFN